MNARFSSLIKQFPAILDQLLDVAPVKPCRMSLKRGTEAVYLFSECDKHLYAGRARDLKRRLRNHYNGNHASASFAVKLAREETGIVAVYSSETSAKYLIKNNPDFAAAFDKAKARIRNMDVRWIEVSDHLEQTLLEIYVSVALATKYNDWSTT